MTFNNNVDIRIIKMLIIAQSALECIILAQEYMKDPNLNYIKYDILGIANKRNMKSRVVLI